MAKVFSKGGWGIVALPVLLVGVIFVYLMMPDEVKQDINQVASQKAVAVMNLTLTRFPQNIGDHYEIWLRNPNGGEQPVGYFKVLAGGSLVNLAGDPFGPIDLNDVPRPGATLIVTIEPGENPVLKRSERILVQGDFKETSIDLKTTVPVISGEQSALLANPTQGKQKGVRGIWFAKDAVKISGGLNIPKASEGWTYGSFVTTDKKGTFFLGYFSDPNKSDQKSFFGGSVQGWSVPGEDFITNAPKGVSFPLELNDGKTQVIVSLEPDYRNLEATGSTPHLPIMEQRIPYKQAYGKIFPLEIVNREAFPGGSGTIEKK